MSPAHTPDIVLYIDAITIVFEEASKGGPSSPLPIACIEAGNDHNLPNLALRLSFTSGVLSHFSISCCYSGFYSAALSIVISAGG